MKKGDIIICSNPITHGQSVPQGSLIIGEQYLIVDDGLLISDEKFGNVISVENVKTGKYHPYVFSNEFITMDVYRHFKLKEILD